jgi:carbamoyl-phosphate synthase large subunit
LKTDSGIAVAARTVHQAEAIEFATRILQKVRTCYASNIQFRRSSDGVLKLLEINPRFPGTLPLTAEAGIDIPKLLVAEISGSPMPDKPLPFKELTVVRYWTEHYFPSGTLK